MSSFQNCTLALLAPLALATLAQPAVAGNGPFFGTTVITHGFTFSPSNPTTWCGYLPGDCPGPTVCPSFPPPSDWLFEMAAQIRNVASGFPLPCPAPTGATILVYDPCTGAWNTFCGSEDPNEEVVLIFNWRLESDGLNEGGTFGFAEGAADALYAALRDPQLPAGLAGRDLVGDGLHFIGHSRGTVVNSECVERLIAAGLAVDQVTTLDPHPVDGVPFPDWGDPEPRVWSGVGWSDNYWRDDFNPADFNGQPITGAYDRNLECVLPETEVSIEHIVVNPWYQGTIDGSFPAPPWWYDDDGSGGAECDAIPPQWETGYYFSQIAGGAGQRPASGEPQTPTAYLPSLVYNGDFETVDPLLLPGNHVGHAGWRYHGGNVSGLLTPWSVEGANHFLKLDSNRADVTHNRLYVDADARAIRLDRRRGGSSIDDRFEVVFYDTAAPSSPILVGFEQVATLPGAWQTIEYTIDSWLRGASYLVELRVVDPSGGSVETTYDVDVDEIELVIGGSVGFCNGVDLVYCPCSNPGNEDSGCEIAQHTGGVRADATFQNTDTQAATIVGTGFPPMATPTAIVLRANNREDVPVPFGDGIRCVGIAGFVRLASTNATNGTSTHAFWHGSGSGDFHYQIWFRNTPASYCVTTGASSGAFNLSNGQTMTW